MRVWTNSARQIRSTNELFPIEEVTASSLNDFGVLLGNHRLGVDQKISFPITSFTRVVPTSTITRGERNWCLIVSTSTQLSPAQRFFPTPAWPCVNRSLREASIQPQLRKPSIHHCAQEQHGEQCLRPTSRAQCDFFCPINVKKVSFQVHVATTVIFKGEPLEGV